MRKTRNLNRLTYFAAVVEHGSFTAASDALEITKAVVSQQVAKLEDDTGTALLIRTTRRVQPTDAGKAFYAHCLNILREAESAFDQISQAASAPVGLLRVAAPLDFGISVVAPAATAFKRQFPECDVSMTLEDRVIDLLTERIDLSVRVGWLADSTLKSRKIGEFRQLTVATPNVAGALRRSAGPEALADLPFVANSVLRNPLLWRFAKGRESRTVRMTASIVANATMAVHAAVLAGGGFGIMPDFLIASDLASGRLVRLCRDWRLPSGGVHLVFPASKYRPPKTTAFVEVLSRQLGEHELHRRARL
jgi:DNA-binding transcriptional LysR family regulator